MFQKGHYTNASMLEEIHHYACIYHAFLYGDEKYSKELNRALMDLLSLKQTTQFLFLFRVFDDLENGIIEENTVVELLRFMLNYSIRRVICDIPSNSLRGLYKTLYPRVFNRPENKENYVDAVVSFFLQLTSRDAYIDDEMFRKSLKRSNLYRKNALCKYLLSEIENQSKEKVRTDNMTIEHILPQNKNLSSEWQNMLGENWAEEREILLHTLGNLTLTAYNSELGDKPFADKKQFYKDSKSVILNADIVDCEVWNAEAINQRAENLSAIILKLYPFIKPKTEISFADPRYQEYSCDDPKTATYKTPNYYILQGERVKVWSYSDMMRSVMQRLYESDKTVIEEMARNNERIMNGWQNIFFSYDKTKVGNSNYKIKGSEIYITVNSFSASDIIQIIRTLLDRHDIDRSDFCYSARMNVSNDKSEE